MTTPSRWAASSDERCSSTREASRAQIRAAMPGLVRTFSVETQNVGMSARPAGYTAGAGGAPPPPHDEVGTLRTEDAAGSQHARQDADRPARGHLADPMHPVPIEQPLCVGGLHRSPHHLVA
jgi:hypothetical protein